MKKIRIAKESRPKKNRHRIRPARHILFALLIIFLVSSGWQLYQLHSEVTQKIARLNEQKSLLLEEKKDLEDEIVQLNTPSYIEKLAREQIGLVKDGEIQISPKQ